MLHVHVVQLLNQFRFTACLFSFCYLPPSQVSDKKIDTILSAVRAVTRERLLISLAKILVVNGKC